MKLAPGRYMFWRVSWFVVGMGTLLSCGGQKEGGGTPAIDGTWMGHIDGYEFPSGSDAVTMVLSLGADGHTVSGTVAFSDLPAPPPATDPNIGYPRGYHPGFPPPQPSDGGQSVSYRIVNVVEGFRYSIVAGTFDGARLTLRVGENEVWTRWCALQSTTYPVTLGPGTDPYWCLPNRGFSYGPNGCGLLDPSGAQYVPIDCGKLALCGLGGPCQCSAHGCQVAPSQSFEAISFDMGVTLAKADGTASGLVSPVSSAPTGLGEHQVHVARVQ